jgi:8-oxo-dGTP pyrophosphatase MutT (NUDIX family)
LTAPIAVDRRWLARRLVGAEHRAALVPGDVRVDAPPDAAQAPPMEARVGAAGASVAIGVGADTVFERARTPAAVLVALVARPQGVTVLLTQRASHLAHHAGQIAFPGGRHEPDDGTAVITALREAEEEVGLARAQVEVLGVLPQYRTRTGYLITPVVGWIEPPVALVPDPGEVAEVFEMPLAFALDPANHQRHFRDAGGERRYFYVLPYEDRYIWGATAAMLVNLHHVLSVD